MICPNCGADAMFTEHSDTFTETHGLDCGPYETWTESWLTCNECGGKTDDAELRATQPPEEPDWDDLDHHGPPPDATVRHSGGH